MIEVGIVPTIHGYAAVGLRKTLGKRKTMLIRSPIPVSEELKTRILGNLSRGVADYLWEVGRWEGIGFVVFLWALAEIGTLAASRIWSYGFKTLFLYGWVRLWFLSSGILLFFPHIFKVIHRGRTKKVRKFYQDKGKVDIQHESSWPTIPAAESEMDEIEYVQMMMKQYPNLAPYYKQMLEIDPPKILDLYPFTVIGRIRNWIVGPPIRLPRCVFHMGARHLYEGVWDGS